MSNQINVRCNGYRSQLLATASAIVLLSFTYGANRAAAAGSDVDRPPLWIELGWQFERAGGEVEPFAPSFFDSISANGFTSPLKLENELPWSYGADGKISFQPDGSDWIFSASLRYGRAGGRKAVHEQTPGGPVTVHFGNISTVVTPDEHKFAQTKIENSETHAILDFQAGKDVRLGMFGPESTSVLSAGVRYARIKSQSDMAIYARPDAYFPTNLIHPLFHHSYTATDFESRSFKGLGPSLSWNASAFLAGNRQDAGITLDWGINAAVLFGKQKASGHHETKSAYYRTSIFTGKYNHHNTGPVTPHDRSRTVAVPNVGGFAGLSLNWTNAKVSLGYRADIFFNAMDGGMDTAKKENRGFYGPFATISMGIGG